jgi:hypothetical protein
MRMQSQVTMTALELKKGGDYNGKPFQASSVFHLSVDMAGSQNKEVFGDVSRGFKMNAEIGESFRHLGNSLPITVDAVFDVTAGVDKDGKPTTNMVLLEVRPLKKVAEKA